MDRATPWAPGHTLGGVQPDRHDSDDEAWRAIVENYGERAELDEPPYAEDADAPAGAEADDPWANGTPPVEEDEERFVPPPPPPLPRLAPDRLVAWAGVLGSPVVLLVALIFSIPLPSVVGYLLVAAFVGGFIYLVLKMPRGPRDPWDDGAQI